MSQVQKPPSTENESLKAADLARETPEAVSDLDPLSTSDTSK